jgi:NAD(P)-dependent dehydrogenase (short-subunit alcohol dehydrogenase family)
MVHYGVTKTAQIAVARGIAESVAGTGVTVNSILAGPTESEGVGAFVEAIASSDLHNLVYRADYRIVPAVNRTASS